jgi:hypothetical protein
MDISGLNALMAEIWHEHEHKPILATQRFVAATTPPAKPDQMVLLKAEQFFEETNNRQELERILKIRAITTTGETRVEALEKSARYYIDHSRYQSAAMELIQLLEIGTKPRQWYLDILLHTDQMESAIVSRVSAAMLNATDDEPRGAQSRAILNEFTQEDKPENLSATHLQVQRLQSVYLLAPPKVSVDFAKITGLNDNVGRIVGRCCAGRRRVQCSCHGCGRR